MKYHLRRTKRYSKSLKKMIKRGNDLKEITKVVRLLVNGEKLPPKYKDHALHGDLEGFRDCHIENDWVLLYYIDDDVLVLTLSDTGSHSDLF